ncbi:MAG: FMN-binding protein [Candidatus Scalindua sp.]
MLGLTFFCLGVLTFASVIVLVKLSKRFHLNWISWGGLSIGIILILFCIAWSVSSTLEGEPRAASMGTIFFGFSGIILLSFTGRYIGVKGEKIETPVIKPVPAKEEIVPELSQTREQITSKPVKQYRASEKSNLGNAVSISIKYFAYISLVSALIVGMTTGKKDYEAMVRDKFQHDTLTKINENPVVFQLGEKGTGPGNYVMMQEGQGYGGPFVLGIRIMEDTRIHEVIPLENRETPAFVKKIEDAKFREQFVGKLITDDYIVGVDVDAVTGATITCMAATESIRKGAHIAAIKGFKMKPVWRKVPWKFGPGEVLILVLFILAFIPKIYSKSPWKYVYMVASIGIVGFYLNASISIGSLSGLVMGYIPGIKDHIIWWVLTVGTVLGIIILGKNVYCFRICPFYWIEFLLNKISGVRLNLSPAIQKRSKFIVNFFLWFSLMTIFLSSHPALGAYEPFAMMFSLEGMGVQWYILPIALIGSFFVSSFWCRYFCPVGNTFTNMLRLRRNFLNLFKQKRTTKREVKDNINNEQKTTHKSGLIKSGWSHKLVSIIFIITSLFVIGFFYQSIVSFFFPE